MLRLQIPDHNHLLRVWRRGLMVPEAERPIPPWASGVRMPDETPEPPEPESALAPVRLPLEETLDLHAFSPREIPDVVLSYLEEAAAHGFTEVRIIHGKGTGFQRQRVQELLARNPLVESYGDAPAGSGHWGATMVRLRRA